MSLHNGSRCALGAALIAVVAASSGCTAPPKAPQSTPASAFGGTDTAWIEVTIAMDEQVRPLLDLVPHHAADPALPPLAARVHAFVDAELSTLHQLHDRAALPSQNPHEGMVMPGLVPSDQVTRAATLTGPAFDQFAGPALREFLTHGADLARSELRNGREPATKALATAVLDARTAALPAPS
jgi:hypothetical protein